MATSSAYPSVVDRITLHDKPRTTVWRSCVDLSEEFVAKAGKWCIYGDPCLPHSLTDGIDGRVLWGTCGHPVDLSDDADRHALVYLERATKGTR